MIPISTLRFALRTSNSYLIDLLVHSRGQRDFTDALILAAMVQSNSATLAGDVALQQRYGVFEAPPPASVRRPISISAVSASLGLPFETVRRRMKRLVAAGVCDHSPDGVRYSDAMLASPEHLCILEAHYKLTRAFYGRLRRAGGIELFSPPQAPAWADDRPPLRVVYRLANDYFLRMMEHLIPQFPNLSRAFIVLAVVRLNTAGFPDTLRGGDGLDPRDYIPDSYRKPARASAVASELGLPGETVRRNLMALVEDGRCRKLPGGYIVPAEVLARANVITAWDANLRDLARLFGDLAETGVLALWDAELDHHTRPHLKSPRGS